MGGKYLARSLNSLTAIETVLYVGEMVGQLVGRTGEEKRVGGRKLGLLGKRTRLDPHHQHSQGIACVVPGTNEDEVTLRPLSPMVCEVMLE